MSGGVFNFYGNKELKLQFYLQAKLLCWIPVPRADHYDMQMEQQLAETTVKRNYVRRNYSEKMKRAS